MAACVRAEPGVVRREAVRSYLQYRVPLQTSADFYTFELRDLLADTAERRAGAHCDNLSVIALRWQESSDPDIETATHSHHSESDTA